MLRFILFIAVFGTLSCSKDAPVSSPQARKAIADDVASDRAVLMAFYKATDGDNWNDNTNWLSEKPLGSWYGVDTDSKGRVRVLGLDRNNLIGYLPSELGRLTKLERLSLYVNQLTGVIPSELSQLTNLAFLNLGSNQLTGAIPSKLSQLTNLTRLNLQSNQLMGAIPSELSQLTNLTLLRLGSNQLTGAIPSELSQLTNLTRLNLQSNQLMGAIPSELSQLTNLTFLDLGYNQLTGVIPSELSQLTNLTLLNLGSNQLTGAIPSELSQLTNLTFLDLGYNQLMGAIPSELSQLTNLTLLRLDSNQLTGAIPSELSQLTNLEKLMLGGNQFTGCIPNTLRNLPLSDHFQYADLDQLGILFCGEDDQLERAALIAFYKATGGSNWKNMTNWLTDAPLDKWYGVDADAFGRVTAIDLNSNGLRGAIPPEIKELTSLKTLWLGYNQLTDVTELGNLTGLTKLMLPHNQLGGNLPSTDLTKLMLGDTQLKGSLPSFAQLTNLQELWLQGNQLTDISPLATLAALSEATLSKLSLTLSYNQITDISPLENLTNLGGLWLGDNQIADISPLENLTKLKVLQLTNNRVADISPLENLTNLWSLGLSGNRIANISPLENLTNLSSLGLGSNRITDISSLENLTKLKFVRLSDNQIVDILPLLNLMVLEELYLGGNPLNSSELQTIRTLEERGVLVFSPPIVESVFNIELVYLENFSDSQKEKIDFAVQRWTSMLTADLPDYEFTSDWWASCGNQSFEIRKGERIDDLRIYVSFLEPGDWANGRGGHSLLRDNHLPVVGCMEFKALDFFYNIYLTALHEVGHVLGFGTTWRNNGLLQEASRDFPNGDPHFDGPLAVAAFDEAGGHVYKGAKVPVSEFLLPNGEYDNSHWRGSVFGDGELMTITGGEVLSAITLQSLADLGYSVDLSQADVYTLSAPRTAKSVAAQDRQPFCDLSGLPEPVYVSEIE